MKPYYEPQTATDLVALNHNNPSPSQIRRYPLRNRQPPQTY
jgi:hypothetical protein